MTRNPFDRLGKDVIDALGEAPSQPPGPEQARLLHQMQGERRRRNRNLKLVAASVVLLAAGGGTWSVLKKPPALQLYREGGGAVALSEWLGPRGASLRLRASDGTRLTLEGGGRAHVSEISASRVRVALESGRLRARVRPRRGVHWSFRAGPYEVRVIGTQLSIDWAPTAGALAVGVNEGAVRVRGDHLGSDGVIVKAGQQLDAILSRRSVSVTPITTTTTTPPRTADARVAVDQRPPRRDATVARQPSLRWRKVARAGDYRGAVRWAKRAGIRRLLRSLSAADLLELGDAARLASEVALAVRIYRALQRRFSRSAQGSLAAFRLGQLYFDQLRDYARAARWFKRYLSKAPRGALASDARGRLMLALSRAGKLAQARQVAKQYLALHPGGTYASSAKSLLGP